ncbi:MAG: dihydropteroate synthase, partial [Thermoanaerobaculia bacterium]|nr:dihydropteroate synthase [Thermoanaerobaculia bacterium]
MGILNLTPDSFSDGGRYLDLEKAVAHGVAMVAAGADLLDLGAESTRPAGTTYGRGALEVTPDEEIRRLVPVVERLRAAVSVPISVDTRKGVVARAALAAGADLINDVTGLSDPDLGEAVATARVPVVLMHLRGTLPDIQHLARYDDVVSEVRSELESALHRAECFGISRRRIVLDPGIGFAKGNTHNLVLIRRLPTLASLGCPLLVGASRKRFIGEITGT